MAKMFYTLEEASERLGLDEDAVKAMAQEGQLQQFRDRDKLMFKRDQIDEMADSSGSSQAIPLSSMSLRGRLRPDEPGGHGHHAARRVRRQLDHRG